MIELVTSIFEGERSAYEALAESFFVEGNLPGKFDFQHFRQTWNAIQAQGNSRLWKSTVEQEITGLLGAVKMPDLMTGDLHVTEIMWYVTPKWRVGSQGMRLFMKLGEWVEELKAKRLLMKRITGVNDTRMHEFYLEHLFREIETGYVREFNW